MLSRYGSKCRQHYFRYLIMAVIPHLVTINSASEWKSGTRIGIALNAWRLPSSKVKHRYQQQGYTGLILLIRGK